MRSLYEVFVSTRFHVGFVLFHRWTLCRCALVGTDDAVEGGVLVTSSAQKRSIALSSELSPAKRVRGMLSSDSELSYEYSSDDGSETELVMNPGI